MAGRRTFALRNAISRSAVASTAGHLRHRDGIARARTCALLFPALGLVLFLMMLGGAASAGQKPSVAQYLVGTVKDALGRPIARATVTLQSGDGRTIARTLTDDRGRFRLPQGSARTYALAIRKQGFKPGTII